MVTDPDLLAHHRRGMHTARRDLRACPVTPTEMLRDDARRYGQWKASDSAMVAAALANCYLLTAAVVGAWG